MRVVQFFLSGVCHQLPEHSLHFGGRPLPLCARCMGTFLGVLMALFTLWAIGQGRRSRLPPWRVGLVLAGLTGLWAVDGLNSLAALVGGSYLLYRPRNSLRLITGMGNGLTIGVVLYSICNYAVWRQPDERRVLDRTWQLLALLLAGAAAATLVLVWRSAPFLFWTILASLSVATVLMTVNAILVMLIVHKEGSADNWLAILPYFGAGFLAACVETGLLALVRRVFIG